MRFFIRPKHEYSCLYNFYAFSFQRHKELLSQKAVASSRECLHAADSLKPLTEPTADCLDSTQPIIKLTGLTENQQKGEEEELNPTSQDITTISATCNTDQDLLGKEEETTSQASGVQERPAELPAGSQGEPELDAAAEDTNEGGEKEAPAVPEKNSNTAKAKTTAKRRSGRAANRR